MWVRNRVLLVCGLIFLVLFTVRVIVVNKNADKVPTYIYDVGETVDFGNDYVDTVEECIDGYAVQVLGYEVVDTKELYERYNMGQADEATVKNTPFYCLLKVRIYNKDCDLGEEGGLMLDRYSLTGDNYMALVSENVFCTMYPDMPGIAFSLRKGTSMEFELHYPITRTEGCTKEDMQKNAPMLEISEFPNRKLLRAG